MNNKTILVVDDEKIIADNLKFNLEREGYIIEVAYNGQDAITKANEIKPDLILLDVMMSPIDGYEVCRIVRKKITCPIIMLTAVKIDTMDKVVGLEMGADDYVAKPYEFRELLARIKANLRRAELPDKSEEDEVNTNGFKIKDMFVDSKSHLAIIGSKVIDLTPKEFELLKLLYNYPNEVFSREQILKTIWDYEYFGDIRTVDVTIRRLREKLGDNGRYILTKRGMGYYVSLR
ncbi:MAG: winged helix-turn-helix domain-containing protein [Clostridia bacterium]